MLENVRQMFSSFGETSHDDDYRLEPPSAAAIHGFPVKNGSPGLA